MFPIVKKRVLNETVTLMEIEAPLVARKALPGQFIIFRIDEEGERIPLTIAGYDREKGTVTIIFQKVGYTTMKLDTLNEGDALLDFVGPLGDPSHTEGVKRAAVIGGGVLGLEAASSLAEAGLSVTVLEHGDQLMKRQIDAQAAQHLESAMAGKGVKLLKNADSARIDASGVTLVDGTRVPAELVIVSAGVRANIRLAKDAGIAAERHITVDDHMRTNLPDVYAAGDCASMGVSYALWTEAADMGRIAGINAAGGDAAYQALPRPLIFHGFGTALFAFGDTGRQANIAYEIGEMPGARYYSAGGKLVGAVLTGDIRRMEEVTNLILQA